MTRRGALAEHPSHSPKENVFPRQDTSLAPGKLIVLSALRLELDFSGARKPFRCRTRSVLQVLNSG